MPGLGSHIPGTVLDVPYCGFLFPVTGGYVSLSLLANHAVYA